MQQLDLFHNNETDYLVSELNKTQNSMERQFRCVFGLIGELQRKYIDLKGMDKDSAV